MMQKLRRFDRRSGRWLFLARLTEANAQMNEDLAYPLILAWQIDSVFCSFALMHAPTGQVIYAFQDCEW